MKKIILLSVIILILFTSVSMAIPNWEIKEDSNFTIHYVSGEEKLAQKTLDILTENRRRINVQLDFYPKEKTKIFICNTHQLFRELTKGAIPDWGAGVAYPYQNRIVLKSPKIAGRQMFSYQQTVIHEYTHIALGQVLGDARVPTWFHEGMAMYQAGQFHFNQKAKITWASLSGNLPSLSSLDSGFPYRSSEARLAYLQSLTAIEFMMENWGEKKLLKLIETTEKTGNFDTALGLAWGINRTRFEEQWRSYINKKYNWGLIFTNPFVWWILIVILFFIAYWRKRKKANKILKKWETEEMEEDLGIEFQD